MNAEFRPAPGPDADPFAPVRQALTQQRAREALALLDALVPSLQAADAAATCEASVLRARAAWAIYELTQAYAGAWQALALLPQEAREARIEMLDIAAHCLSAAGLFDEALALAREGVDLATAPPQCHAQLPQALGTLAHVCAQLGRYQEAEMLHLQALSRARESREAHSLTRAYSNALLAGALAVDELRRRGNHEEANAFALRQLRLASQARPHLTAPEMSDRQRVAFRLNVALAQMHGGRPDQAMALIDEAEGLLTPDGPPHAQASLRLVRGECALLLDDLALARSCLEPLMDGPAQQDFPFIRAPLLRNARQLFVRLGDAGRAADLASRLSGLEEEQRQQRRQSAESLRTVQRHAAQWLVQLGYVPSWAPGTPLG